MSTLKRVTLLLNPRRPLPQAVIDDVNSQAAALGVTLTTAQTLAAQANTSLPVDLTNQELIIACGGDGTVIQACHRSRDTGTPVIGVNSGHLGYLASLSPQTLPECISGLLQGLFRVELRSALKITVHTPDSPVKELWALNELSLDRVGALAKIKLKLNHQLATEYHADGLNICTATGSTAYNLSLGGPVISPDLRIFSILAKAPLSLVNRPLLVGENTRLELCLEETSGAVRLELDGINQGELPPNTTLLIQRSSTDACLAFYPDHQPFLELGAKLGWNKHHLTVNSPNS
jgi:NAD+ kinase